MNDYIASRKFSFDVDQAGEIEFAEISPITRSVIESLGDSSLDALLDSDPVKANAATLKLMSEYYAVAPVQTT